MGEKTAISWCDHTFNPWIGCSKVSPGCDLCYAEAQNRRYNWNPEGWGPGKPRKRTSPKNWSKPLEWATQAAKEGVVRRVFCASLADVFDAEVDQYWRDLLWTLVAQCADYESLEWLILTKRPENIEKMMYYRWLNNPPDFIRIGVTAENQENADRRIPELLRSWKGKNFISYEPALGPIDYTALNFGTSFEQCALSGWYVTPGLGYDHEPIQYEDGKRIDWVICGGESGAGCRPMDLAWARSVRDQCKAAGVPFFFKQVGGFPHKQDDPAAWPEDLRVQEFPI